MKRPFVRIRMTDMVDASSKVVFEIMEKEEGDEDWKHLRFSTDPDWVDVIKSFGPQK